MSHKNDPDYHDVRAKILLEAAQHLDELADEKFGNQHFGFIEAAKELRRVASNARKEHAKVRDRKRRASRAVRVEA